MCLLYYEQCDAQNNYFYMLKKFYLAVGTVCAAALLSACTNNDYDLTNIDTTVSFAAKNLTLPLKVTDIKFSKVLNLKDGDQIKKLADPSQPGDSLYAVIENGTISFEIGDITTTTPYIQPIVSNLPMDKIGDAMGDLEDLADYYELLGHSKKEAAELAWADYVTSHPGDEIVMYNIDKNTKTTFTAESYSVDKSVRSIESVSVATTISVSLTLTNLESVLREVLITDLKLQLPKGLTVASVLVNDNPIQKTLAQAYDKVSGVLDLTGENTVVSGGKISLALTVGAIDAALAGVQFTPGNDYEKGVFKFNGEVIATDGVVKIEANENTFVNGKTFRDLPAHADYVCTPKMSGIDVIDFTGKIEYNSDIDPVTIGKLPSILQNEETNIVLGNPQIYFSISDNPLSGSTPQVKSNLTIVPEKGWVEREAQSLDFNIKSGPQTFCFSPEDPEYEYVDPETGIEYPNAQWNKFTGLKNILEGEGMPDKLNVYVKLLEQRVEKLKIGHGSGTVEGCYSFFAPLSIDPSAQIIYVDSITDIKDDTKDLEKIKLSQFEINAKASTDIPAGATLVMTAIDEWGLPILDVEFVNPDAADKKISLPGYADEAPFRVVAKGSGLADLMKNLDGIEFYVIMKTTDEKPLSPSQKIRLNDIKVTVSGEYTDEL